ncbi:MAG: cation transporting ATPase C-terminal domain-containing protein, partial [Clostridia bacterium]|nr:cation transporting ATPase C-terminal domain-containing protein [Clostridia bacterium]
EVLTLFIAVTILQVQIFTPVMILWINLVTDSLPALALGMEHAEPDVMEKPPRKAKGSLFGGGVGIDIFVQGIMQTVLVLGVYLLSVTIVGAETVAEQSAMAFLTLGFVQLFHAYNMRSRELSLFREGVFNNKYMNGAFLGAALLQVVVVIVPFLAGVFDIHTLTLAEWAMAIIGGFLIIPMVEIYKLIKRTVAKKKAKEI